MPGLFDNLHDDQLHRRWADWRPQPLPVLDDRFHDIELDFETYGQGKQGGLKWWNGAHPCGFAIYYGDRIQYVPVGHKGGNNLDEKVVKQWAHRELRGKRITNLNTRFDVHISREWGVDLEAQDNEVSDVGHYAALLDDHRYEFSLKSLVRDFLPDEQKVEVVDGKPLDPERMADYPAGMVAVRAEADVRQVHKLKDLFWPRLTEEGLHTVRALEDQVIYVVCEMEKNGAPIDVVLLHRWVEECEQEYLRILWSIHRDTGLKFEPTTKGWVTLFGKLGIPISEFTDKGAPSFTDDVLKHVDHSIVQRGRRAARLKSLNSKYLTKYKNSVGSDGILRYSLHQLRAQKDPLDDHDAGTVTGRFSSTAPVDDEGVNIQQVMKVAKQRVLFGYDEEDDSHDDELFIIRQLHVPRNGNWLSADGDQLQYRIFASYANNPKIIKAYQENPDLSFHKHVWGMIKPYAPLTYRQQKDLNFAVIFAAGLAKRALMLGFISKHEFETMKREYGGRIPRGHPRLAEAMQISQIYDREIPEVGPLLRKASKLAEERGFVKTVLGRRMRFPQKFRLHKALNGVVQGSEADIMKTKLVELHKERNYTGLLLRYTVHDEVDGDAQCPYTEERVREVLNRQSFSTMRVPITWGVSTGENWKECA
jgi:DNA polymerase-1